MQCIFSILAMAVILPTAAMAQHPQTRQGFGYSLGIGAGTCGGCSSYGGTGLSGYGRLGVSVTPSLFLGGESNGWIHYDGSVVDAIVSLMAVVQWYPMAANGLYLKGGVGHVGAIVTVGDFAYGSSSGFSASLGTGYDWRVARNFALTPFANYVKMFEGSTSVSGSDNRRPVSLFQFGLGFTWF